MRKTANKTDLVKRTPRNLSATICCSRLAISCRACGVRVSPPCGRRLGGSFVAWSIVAWSGGDQATATYARRPRETRLNERDAPGADGQVGRDLADAGVAVVDGHRRSVLARPPAR
jgi:hypothetical protein